MSSSETQPGATPLPTVGEAISSDKGGANGGQAVRLDPNNSPSVAGSREASNIGSPAISFAQGTNGGWQGPALTRVNANPSPKLGTPGGNNITKDAPGQD